MAKAVGSPKTGGRKKGTPNKRSLNFAETLESRGLNLLEELLDEIEGLAGAARTKALLDLLPYQFPKRRPTEQAPFVLSEYLDKLTSGELEALRTEISGRLPAPSQEEHERLYREVVEQIKVLEDLKDDPDCQD